VTPPMWMPRSAKGLCMRCQRNLPCRGVGRAFDGDRQLKVVRADLAHLDLARCPRQRGSGERNGKHCEGSHQDPVVTHRTISNTADTRSVKSIVGCRYRPVSIRDPVTWMRSSVVFP